MRAHAESHNLSVAALYSWKQAQRCKGGFASTPLEESPLFRKAMVPLIVSGVLA